MCPERTKVGLARSERFELPTLGIEIRCSIQLSYERLSFLRGLASQLPGLLVGSGCRGCEPTRQADQFAFSGLLFKPVEAALQAERVHSLFSLGA